MKMHPSQRLIVIPVMPVGFCSERFKECCARKSDSKPFTTRPLKRLRTQCKSHDDQPSHAISQGHLLSSRRSIIAGLLALSLSGSLPAKAAEGDVDFLEVENSVVGRFVELDPGWKRFETLDFQFDVPDGFTFVPAPPVTTPVGRGRAAPPSPIKAGFKDKEGRQVTVMEYQSSAIKPTFFQLQDIKELGSVSEVATLLAPTGVTFTSQEADEVDQPARDTGTIRGTVRAKPQTLYRFEYRLPTGVHVVSAAVGRSGKVLLIGGTASDANWRRNSQNLKRMVESFQLTFPN